MKKLFVALMVTVFAVGVSGCATDAKTEGAKEGAAMMKKGDPAASKAALAAAKADVAAAKKHGSEWMIIDKVTGRQPISKILAKAEELDKKGDHAEAERLAKKVSWAAKAGVEQAKNQANAMPFYPK